MAVSRCVKYLVFLFNLLFWICGCVILGVGIYLKVSKDGNAITDQYLPSFELMISIGVIIMVIGFLGCCGAYRENRCMLMMVGVVPRELKPKYSTFYLDLKRHKKMDLIYLQLKCCGLTKGPSDWTTPPDSCRCNSTAVDKCPSKIYQEVRPSFSNMELSLGIAFAIAVILIFGMAFSMTLFCQIRKAGMTAQ
uniref:Tetraspanin n=1 Tax=Fundulus heteroclitus TaxID=8078 RepID=A0A3Q2PGT4_FUNHE